jgi:predicted ABC-type ATPase
MLNRLQMRSIEDAANEIRIRRNERLQRRSSIKTNADNSEKTLDFYGKKATLKVQDGRKDGGPGSGNYGHAGVPGQVGGSAPGGGEGSSSSDVRSGVDAANLKNGFGTTNTSDRAKDDLLSKHCDENGKLSAEREELHKDIVAQHLSGVEKPEEGKATYTFLGGGSAAGKSTITNLPEVGWPSDTEAVKIDSDNIKGMLPEYVEMVNAGDESAAKYAHEESSALAKRISAVASENGYSVALDGTGDGSVESMTKKIDDAKAAGMTVNAVYVTCSLEDAISRSNARGDKTGRYVPKETIISTHAKVSQIFPRIQSKFDSVKLYDTSGNQTKLIATGGGGKELTVLDQAAYDAFLAKGK